MKYTIYNTATSHWFIHTNDLSEAIHMFNHIAKRKHGMIALIDNATGELIKYK